MRTALPRELRMVTVAAVAAAFAANVTSVRRWISMGRLRAYRMGAKHSKLRIRLVDLERFTNESRFGAKAHLRALGRGADL